MRRPPPPQDWLKYPVTSGVATLAIFVSVARFAGKDVSFLYMYSDSWHLQPWGLLTSIFPHVDPIHLLFNLYWLWVFGTLVEAVYGPVRTVAIMFLFAVGSSAAEFAIFEGGIGLSGVGYGLFTLLWVLSWNDDRFRGAVDAQTINLFVVWFFLCIFLTYTGILPVGNVAHGMGAILGALLGFCIMAQGSKRQLAKAALGLVIVADFFLASFGRNYVNLDPNRWQVLAYLGYHDIVDHDYGEAVDHLKQALKLNARDEGSWYNLGIAYQSLGNYEEGMEAYGHACELRPRSNQFRDALSTCKQTLAAKAASERRFSEAIKWLQEDLALNENQPHVWFLLATIYDFGLKDRPHAKEAAEHAVKLDPNNTHYQQLLDSLKKDHPSKEESP
jgi:GlpG protein